MLSIRSLPIFSICSRIIAISSQIGISILIIKFVPLNTAGRYYTLTSLAYFGSALVFIGADLYLQKVVIKNRTLYIYIPAILSVIIKFMVIGSVTSALGVCINSIVTSGNISSSMIGALTCGFLSSGMFLASSLRNVSLVRGLVRIGTGVSAIEQFARFALLFMCVAYLSLKDANLMIVASGMGSVIAGITTWIVLKRYCLDAPEANYPFPDWRDVKNNFIPLSLSAFLNLAQLQGYRIIVGDWFGDQAAVGQIATLTVLGLSGAAGVLGLLSQLWLKNLYHGDEISNLLMIKKGIILILILAVASTPLGYVFLHAINKPSLLKYLYLIPIGVLVEGGNFILGMVGTHLNANANSMWLATRYALFAVIVTYVILFCGHYFNFETIKVVAVSLFVGQLSAVVYAIKSGIKKQKLFESPV